MPNAWFYYVFPLGISAVFVMTAIALLRKVLRGDRNAKRKPYGVGTVCSSIFVGGIGGTLGLALLLTSPMPWQRERLFERVFRTPPERIERFVILPGRANQHQPLTRSQVVIDDPARIRRIAEILRTSREVWPNHPRAKWTATVEMVTYDGTYYFRVSATVPGDANGTLVRAQTTAEGGGGWNLGDARADGLDQVLEEAVSTARDH
jgi:hypothetical protein